MTLLINLLVRLLLAYLLFCIVLYFSQTYLLFPIVRFPFNAPEAIDDPNRSIPEGVEVFAVKTSDGEELDTWLLRASEKEEQGRVAIILHGNGETVEDNFYTQQWLASLGITSYVFDYRGYGRSTGWPSEEGVYRDAEAVWNYVLERENIGSESVILIGKSLGSGPAAYLAKNKSPDTLVVLAGYASIPAVARTMWVYKLFVWLITYRFPVMEYVREIPNTKLILAHGKRDMTIPFGHLALIEENANAKGVHSLKYENAGHNDIFEFSKDDIAELLS